MKAIREILTGLGFVGATGPGSIIVNPLCVQGSCDQSCTNGCSQGCYSSCSPGSTQGPRPEPENQL